MSLLKHKGFIGELLFIYKHLLYPSGLSIITTSSLVLSASSHTKQEYYYLQGLILALSVSELCVFYILCYNTLFTWTLALALLSCINPSNFLSALTQEAFSDCLLRPMHLCCNIEASGIAAIISGSLLKLHRETFPLTHKIHPQETIPLNFSNCRIHLNDSWSKQLLFSQELGWECETNKEPTRHFSYSRGNKLRDFSFCYSIPSNPPSLNTQ